jgi:hypothetical protein
MPSIAISRARSPIAVSTTTLRCRPYSWGSAGGREESEPVGANVHGANVSAIQTLNVCRSDSGKCLAAPSMMACAP